MHFCCIAWPQFLKFLHHFVYVELILIVLVEEFGNSCWIELSCVLVNYRLFGFPKTKQKERNSCITLFTLNLYLLYWLRSLEINVELNWVVELNWAVCLWIIDYLAFKIKRKQRNGVKVIDVERFDSVNELSEIIHDSLEKIKF